MWVKLYCKHILNSIREKPVQFFISVFMIILCFTLSLQTLNIRYWMGLNAEENSKKQNGNADILIKTDTNSASRFMQVEDVYRVLPENVKALGSIELPLVTDDDMPVFAVAVDVSRVAQTIEFSFVEYGTVSTSTLDDTVFISEDMAKKYSLHVGDTLQCSYFGMETAYTVQGISRQLYLGNYDAMISVYSVMDTLKRYYPQLALFGDTKAIYSHIYVYIDPASGISTEECAAILKKDAAFADKSVSATEEMTNSETNFFERFIPLIMFLVILLPTITNFCCFYILSKQRTETNRLFYAQGMRPGQQTGLQAVEIVGYCVLGILIGFGLSFGISPLMSRFLDFRYVTYRVDGQYFLNSLYAALLSLVSALLTTAFFAVYERTQNSSRKKKRQLGNYKGGAIVSICLCVVALALFLVMEFVDAEYRAKWGYFTISAWLLLFVVATPVLMYGITNLGARLTERHIFDSIGKHKTPGENQSILLYAFKNLRSCKNYHNVCRLLVMLLSVNFMTMSTCLGALSLPQEFDHLWSADYGVMYASEDIEEGLQTSPLVEDVTHFYFSEIDFGGSGDNRVMALENFDVMDSRYTPTRAPKGNEIAVSNVIADYYRLHVGDSIDGVINDRTYTFVVSEIFAGKSTLAYIDLGYCQELKYNTILVTVKEGVTLSELKANILQNVTVSTAVVMPITEYAKLLYRDASLYIKCCIVMCVGLLIFSIIGLCNIYFETYRTRKGEYELYFLVGMTPGQVRKMKVFEVLILVGISLVCAAVMSLVLVETVRLFFTSHMIDYFRYIFC